MHNARCPNCGHETAPDEACPACAQANGKGNASRRQPAPPPEVAGWVIEPVPPEVRGHYLRTFDEVEDWAAVREARRTAGVNIEDLIAELEPKVHGAS